MAKKSTDDIELPTADEAIGSTEATGQNEPEGDTSLPLFQVSAKGLDSLSFHAVDESEAARLFYKKHGVPSHEHNHKVVRVS